MFYGLVRAPMPTTTTRTGTPVRRRVLIIEDNPFFADCLRSLLDNEADLEVCDIVPTPAEVGERIGRHRPDVLIVDLALGTECGLRLGMHLREQQVFTPIVFVSTLGRPSKEQLSDIGRSTFVAKSRKPADFLAAVREILGSPNGGGRKFDRAEICIDATATKP